MKKFWKWAGIAVLVLVFAGTFVFLYQKSQPKVTMYEILSPSVRDIEHTTTVTGKVEPRDEVSIKPQISGIIAELYKQAGEMVRKDEVIAKVKVIADMSSLSSAENRVRLARLSLDQARTDYERMKRLKERRVVSDEDFEAAELKFHQQQEELSNAEDALNIVREGVSLSNAQLSTTLIRSSIDGLILDIPVKVGNTVILSNSMNDGTTIATVANMRDLIFRGKVDETEVGRLHQGMPLTITVGALPELSLQASLEFISPKGVETNGANQFEIKAAIAIPDSAEIRSGYSANGRIVLERAARALVIPEASLTFSHDSTFVHVLKSAPAGKVQQFERRYITTGISDGVDIQVLSGLRKDEKVRGIEILDKN